MSKFIIEGQANLGGEIAVKGAKNAALKIIPAALLSREALTITNLPQIEDVRQALDLLADLGAKIELDGSRCQVQVEQVATTELKAHFANKLRASIVFVGPLLARAGEVRFPHPGGCVIGAGKRPIDLFLEGFVEFGAELTVENGFYCLKAKRLQACDYFFTTVSVTGTETLMMAAVLAEGTTVLKNCACEPEIKALADYLVAQGARISGAGTPTMIIEGVTEIKAGRFDIIPDRIETGTFAILAAAAAADLKITDCRPEHIEILLSIFRKIGVDFEQGQDWLHIRPSRNLKAYSIKTHEYPGFPTDLQSPYTVLATQSQGSAIIHETIYDRRLLFTDMLTQMGADIIMCDPHRVVVNGPTPLYGRKLTSPDLRAGIAMIIAGLIAQGKTEIDNIYQIERGYEQIDARLRSLGARINKVEA